MAANTQGHIIVHTRKGKTHTINTVSKKTSGMAMLRNSPSHSSGTLKRKVG